jgi:DNA polymerase-3 subunit epsilon
MWWDGPLAAFDLETTAADPEEARIVSAALVKIGPAIEGQYRDVERHTWLVNPGVEIPQEAIDVHGITNEQAREGAPAPAALQEIGVALLNAGMIVPVVIQNARYDLTVLDRELRRHFADALEALRALTMLKVIDPLVIDKHLDRYRPKRVASHSLEDCCKVWNVPLEGVAHDAAFDAIAAVRLAWRLGRSGRVIRRTRDDAERREFIELAQEWERVRGDLGALHVWQERIAGAEAERLQEYFRRGDPRKDVPPQPDRVCPREWPIIPLSSAG